ncbi:receptor-like serine/threonine-protein kinase SD1-7 [Ipomoea triloba]|uniref:receptor-like serine/threonine-protein kinase SD1-7 n=1 Tax=Ipomoea triloba TaxID=35885 RepID=UPI00125E210B|nr:receptor-like serine/threonine-protein kinase SD1-7 [Ipomoea triloba]
MLHSFILLLNYIALIAVVSHAKNTLLSDEVLSSDGRNGTLTFLESQNKLFRLQFLRRQGTQNDLYLGIQYMYGANAKTTIWVSNANEIFSGSLFLKMEGNGRLIVGDGSSDKFFVVNDRQSSVFNSASATLRDDGNLVLTSPNRSHFCWQSFEHPSNVFFPGMKLGLSGIDTQTPSNRVLTSWISDGNPSPGEFELGVNPNQPNELIIKRRGVVYWGSGEWKRQNFTFLDFPAGSGANMTNYSNAKKAYFSLSGGSQLGNGYSFIRLNSRGGIDAFIWNATTKTVEPLAVVVCDPDEALRRGVALSGGCSATSKKAPPPASSLAPAIAPATLAGRTWNWRKHLARWKLAAIVSLVVAIVIALSAVSLFNRFKRRRGYRRGT